MKLLEISLFLLLFFTFSAGTASAHPGRTDANGGHTCHTNCAKWGLKDGEYHFHNGGKATAPKEPVVVPTKTPAKKVAGIVGNTVTDNGKLYKVVKVLDGDTIEVSVNGKNEKVRLLAIDAPEISDTRKQPQCYSKEATKKLSSIVSGKFVKLVNDPTQGNKDKYQRLLRYVYADNTFVNAELVKQGFARSYKSYPTKYLKDFNTYEKQAQTKQLGLWKACR